MKLEFTVYSFIQYLVGLRLNLKCNAEERARIATGHTVSDFRAIIDVLRNRFEPYHDGRAVYKPDIVNEQTESDHNLYLPPWICQPYMRMAPDDHIALLAEKKRIAEDPEREKKDYFDSDGLQISRKRMKKLRRASRKPAAGNQLRSKVERMQVELCVRENCLNPKVFDSFSRKTPLSTKFSNIFFVDSQGLKCEHEFCRTCCRHLCYNDSLECVGHGFLLSRKNRAKKRKAVEDQPIGDHIADVKNES